MDDYLKLKNKEKYDKIIESSKGNYYFYQWEDETNSFLDPLWMKLLLKEYGSYLKLPHKISSNILEIEEYNMSDSLRRRFYPISHLPLSSEFKFIEIDMSNLVSFNSYEYYEKQIRNREKLRDKKRDLEDLYNKNAIKINQNKHQQYLNKNLEINIKLNCFLFYSSSFNLKNVLLYIVTTIMWSVQDNPNSFCLNLTP